MIINADNDAKQANSELKPVVHYHDSLNFEASNALTNVIADVRLRLWGIILPLTCVFIYRSLGLFNIAGQTITPGFLITDIALAMLAIWVARYQFKRVASAVSQIAARVCITDEIVSVIPFTFNLFFEKQNPTHHFEFKINELKIRKTDNPLRFTWALDNRVFELRDKEKEAYIVFDYFDKTLKEKLTEILVEVTPPELLIPGRLRHY